MSITSLSFLLFVAVVIVLYYMIPNKKDQWIVLLAASCFFYLTTGIKNIIYVLITAGSTYFATAVMQKMITEQNGYLKEHKAELSRDEKKAIKQRCLLKRRWVMVAAMLLNFGILCVFKYLNFILEQVGGLVGAISGGAGFSVTVDLIVPLGISFYTFQTMGYLADVYWEKAEHERNFGKMLLFVSFFPQMTQGPISSYGQLSKELFTEHKFSYQNYSYGCQRMIWGFFKKLVVADLLAPFVGEIFANYRMYPGVTVLMGAFMYSAQIYADFSGYMDIVCGFSEILGIKLAENFDRPYFSKSIAEYWRRWHITLGAWFKTYIYYPIAVSKWNRNLGKAIQKRFGASAGKSMPASIALVAVWLTTGLWHGASWGYIAWGGVNGLFIIFSLWMEPIYGEWKHKLHIRENSGYWRGFQTLRTFVLVTFIKVLPEVGTLQDGFGLWMRIFTNHDVPKSLQQIVPAYQGVGDLLNIMVILFGVFLMLFVSLLQRKQKVRAWMGRRPRFVRWGSYLLLVFLILVFGTGSAKESFMYAQF